MAALTIRARVHAGNLDPLDVLPLPEGSETAVVIEVPEDTVTTIEQPMALGLGSYPPVSHALAARSVGTKDSWRAFLKNHVKETVAIDFFVVPTVRNQVLSVFLLLAHDRRRVIHFNVTTNPTAEWTAQQIVEAFPWQDPVRYLLCDRDKIYGQAFRKRVTGIGLEEVLTAARSLWQNPYVERPIGTIRRDCLDHVIVVNERHLKRIVVDSFTYCRSWRKHLSLEMDCTEPREIHSTDRGRVVESSEIGGLHHHYQRIAAWPASRLRTLGTTRTWPARAPVGAPSAMPHPAAISVTDRNGRSGDGPTFGEFADRIFGKDKN